MTLKAAAIISILFVIVSITPASGQTENKPSAETFIIGDQPDSPLKLSLERQGPNTNSLFLRVMNVGTLPVRGYVIRVIGAQRDRVYMSVFVNRFLEPGKWKPSGVSDGYVSNVKPHSSEIWLDYIEFTDGSKWGPDTLGRSGWIGDYSKGYEAAKLKLAELVGAQGGELIKHVEMFGGHTSSEAAHARPDSKRQNYFDLGYEHAIQRLRQLKGPRGEEAKELARRLELVQKSVPR